MVSDKQQKKQKQSNRSDEGQSTLTRIAKIPIVEFSVYLGLSVYSKIKSSSELLNNLFNQTEPVVLNTIETLKPLANKFQKQIDYADSLGNNVLDKIEATVPVVITYQPKNTYANFSNRLSAWKRYLTERWTLVRNFNLDKIVSGGLKSVDSLVDEYLPGGEDEVVDESNRDAEISLINQSLGLFGKLRKRTLKRVQNVQRLVF